MTERPPFDMSLPPPGRSSSGSSSGSERSNPTRSNPSRSNLGGASGDADRTEGPGGVADLLRGLTAPAVPADLRARVLAAADAPGRILSFGDRRVGGGKLLPLVAAAAAAAVVFLVGGRLRTTSDAVAWEALHPEAKSAPSRIRVVDDPARADWTSVSFVNTAFDPLDGP